MSDTKDEISLSLFAATGDKVDLNLIKEARESLLASGIPGPMLNARCNSLILMDNERLFVVVAFPSSATEKPALHLKRFDGAGDLTESLAIEIAREKYGFESPYVFSIPNREIAADIPTPAPPELEPFIAQFKLDHPEPQGCGFIMMRFAATPAHHGIGIFLKNSLAKLGLTGLRADDKSYSDDLFTNIRTYMHACGFGIAVFERLLTDDFNPNVSLEVGYMLALKKPVLLLKDSTLRGLHTDLVGRLYTGFDTQRFRATINIERWLVERGILPKSK